MRTSRFVSRVACSVNEFSSKLIAGPLSWVGFLYAARILGLVTASFMPAITPAIASRGAA